MLSSPAAAAGPGGGGALAGGGGSHRALLWPLAPAQPPTAAPQQTLTPQPAHHITTAEGFSRYGVYSLFPGAGSPAPGIGVGAALYQQQQTAITRHPTAATLTAFHQPQPQQHSPHKVAESLFSPGSYTFAPTPPPGSPFSPSLTIPTIPTLTSSTDLLIKPLNITPSTPSTLANTPPICIKKQISPNITSTEDFSETKNWGFSNTTDDKCCSKQRCGCPNKFKYEKRGTGCSRTNPVKWSSNVSVKREPGITPCQVAEVTTSDVDSNTTVVKLEASENCGGGVASVAPIAVAAAASCTAASASATSTTTQKTEIHLSQTLTNSNIPVGIAVARQRTQQVDISSHHQGSPNVTIPSDLHLTTGTIIPSQPTHIAPLPPPAAVSLLKEVSRITDVTDVSGMAATSAAGGALGGALLQCSDDRATGLAAWPIGGAHHNTPTLATPTLWQYPEPVMPFHMPMPPVGFQLVRDPTSGHFLLIPTASIDQAMVWPSYPTPSSHVLLGAPMTGPPPLAPLQLLGATPVGPTATTADYLATSTTLHQHTQTHSTRLVALTTAQDTKRKVPLPISGHTLIKIEADCTATSTLDHSKAVQQTVSTVSTNSGTVFTDNSVTPLLTTHVFYQHPGNLILSSQTNNQPTPNEIPQPTMCKSQATSPVTCLTPPPEITSGAIEEENSLMVQDAGNQTEILEEESMKPCLLEEVDSETKCEVRKIDEDERVLTPEPEQVETCQNEEEISEKVQTIPEEKDVEVKIENKPDISGLELLSNSIVEYESCRNHPAEVKIEENNQESVEKVQQKGEVVEEIAQMTIKDTEPESSVLPRMDENLGGLNLLCALAEQRFVEEGLEKKVEEDYKHYKQYKKPKNIEKDIKVSNYEVLPSSNLTSPKSKTGALNNKDCDNVVIEKDLLVDKELDLEKEKMNVLKRVSCERGIEKCKKDLGYDFGAIENKKTDESCNNETDEKCSCEKEKISDTELQKLNERTALMTEVERSMRQKIADLQREYQEKQLELSKLTPQPVSSPECGDCHKRAKLAIEKIERTPSPPSVPKIETPPIKYKDILKPPTLCAISSKNPLHLKPPLSTFSSPDSLKRKSDSESPSSTPERFSSSKKRKVGRPKKLLSTPGNQTSTETIVAKKPKKNGLVGFLLAAKNHMQKQLQSKNNLVNNGSPLKYIDDKPILKHSGKDKDRTHKDKDSQHKKKKLLPTSSPEFKKKKHKSKLRPKLKAEPKVKQIVQEEEECSEWEITMPVEDNNVPSEDHSDVEESHTPIHSPIPEVRVCACTLTDEQLERLGEQDKMRVLTAMGGLFYAGQLSPVQPPDVYSITLDGERGNRPHIMSREEILRDAIIEVAPSCTTELLPGTRMCAYWSQQYRCLYPGTVAEPGTPDPQLDLKFVCVEFDDGDSGRIAIEDIRLLPNDYPIIEYDPNPLLSLSKRRRRTSVNSVTEEKRNLHITSTNLQVQTIQQNITESPKVPNLIAEKENTDTNKQENSIDYKERKKLKKKRKDKLKKLLKTDKIKRKKHKCCDEHCKHKKHHKKHRKHKKHHRNIENENTILSSVSSDVQIETPEPENDPDYEIEEEDSFDDINDTIIEETNFVHKKILESKAKKAKKGRERQESVESRSKMAAFLPARQLWSWSGKGYKKIGNKGRIKKQFFKAIQRGKELITVGDSAVFLSTGRPDRPYIGRIESMWESWGTSMVVKVKWFYHPEETVGCPSKLQYPGALFESPHVDENDVQTISHKCEVLPLKEYTKKLGSDPRNYESIYENNDIYYLAGYYDPTNTTLTMEPDIPIV